MAKIDDNDKRKLKVIKKVIVSSLIIGGITAGFSSLKADAAPSSNCFGRFGAAISSGLRNLSSRFTRAANDLTTIFSRSGGSNIRNPYSDGDNYADLVFPNGSGQGNNRINRNPDGNPGGTIYTTVASGNGVIYTTVKKTPTAGNNGGSSQTPPALPPKNTGNSSSQGSVTEAPPLPPKSTGSSSNQGSGTTPPPVAPKPSKDAVNKVLTSTNSGNNGGGSEEKAPTPPPRTTSLETR